MEFDAATRNEINVALSGLPWPVLSYDSPQTFLDNLAGSQRGCVVADVEQVDMPVARFLEALNRDHHGMPLILLSHDIEIPDAVAAMRAGVQDVLPLPVMERALRRQVRSAMEKLASGRRKHV